MSKVSKNQTKGKAPVSDKTTLDARNYHAYNHARTWWMQGFAVDLEEARTQVIASIGVTAKEMNNVEVVFN